MEYTTGY